MKQAEALVAEIRAYCAAHEDPQQAAKYARYFREGYDAWGIMGKEDPLWNAKKEEWLERYRKTGLRGTLKLGELLFAGGKYEEGAIAVQFAARLRDQFDGKLFAGLGAWFAAGIGNWAHTDVLCGEVIAPLVEEGRIGLPDLAPWRASRFPYQRRAVPVALLGLRGPTGPGVVPARDVEAAARAGGGVSDGMEGHRAAPHLPVRHREDETGRARALPAGQGRQSVTRW